MPRKVLIISNDSATLSNTNKLIIANKLDNPEVEASDTTLEFDTVEGAESYDILADGNVIGNVKEE